MRIGFVKLVQALRVDVEYADDVPAPVVQRDDDFGLAAAGAGNVVGMLVNVRDNEGFALRPCLSAHASIMGNARAGYWALEGGKLQLCAGVIDQIKADPKPVEGFGEQGVDIGEVGRP